MTQWAIGIDDAIDPTLWRRFASKIRYGSTFDCWNWTGASTPVGKSGYRFGVIRAFGKTLKASRVCWMLNRGEIPEGMVVRHLCDNPMCVNSGHLCLGTQADNVRDMDERQRRVNGPTYGQKHHNHKITTEMVLEIRASLESPVEIARRIGVSPEQIRNIRDYRQRRNG